MTFIQSHSIVLTIFLIGFLWAFIGLICLALDWHYNRKDWKHAEEPVKEAFGLIALWPVWIYWTWKYGV